MLFVGPRPPPTGGVATHIRDVERAPADRSVAIDHVDPSHDGKLRLFAALARAHARRDLVHVHTNGHNRGSWLLALVCAGPRSILTLHSGLAPSYIADHPYVRHIARAYARVIAVNREIADALAIPVEIVPAWTTRSLAFRLPPPGLQTLRKRHQPLYACALAPGPEYGATLMLDAFAQVRLRQPRAGLLLYGPGTRELADEVSRHPMKGLRQSVALLGELPRERSLAVMAAADVFVRPTLADGDSVSVREALALGRVVVASNVGHRPEAVRTFQVGSAAACAELLFHVTSDQFVSPPSATEDALPTLLKIYQSCGLIFDAVPVGTALAI
jgi:glycosyltransferase involved in cell wall biosynthesis